MVDAIISTMKGVCCHSHPIITRYIHLTSLAYLYPNDEQELDRLDMQHHMFKIVMDGKLYNVPLDNPKQILDIGTGSGIWPIEMGMIILSHTQVLMSCSSTHNFPFLGSCSTFIPKRCNHRHRPLPSTTNRGSRKCPFPSR